MTAFASPHFVSRPSGAKTFIGETFIKVTSTARKEAQALIEARDLEDPLVKVPELYLVSDEVLVMERIRENRRRDYAEVLHHLERLQALHKHPDPNNWRVCRVEEYQRYLELPCPPGNETEYFHGVCWSLADKVLLFRRFVHGDATLSNSLFDLHGNHWFIDLSAKPSPGNPLIDLAKVLFSCSGFDYPRNLFDTAKEQVLRLTDSSYAEFGGSEVLAYFLSSHVIRVHRKEPLSQNLLSFLENQVKELLA